MIRVFLVCGLLCVMGAGGVSAQQNLSNVQMKSTKVAGNVYMLEGVGGNIGVSVGDDGILIVDDQFAPLADKIRAALKELNPGKLKFILNTHWHGDHTGGNASFGSEAPIIAQTNVRKRLKEGNTTTKPAVKEALPVITFDQSLAVHFNGEEIRAIHFPHGHTDSDSIIFFTQSNVVHMGDDFFAGRFPFVDLSSGGSVEGLIKNVQEVMGKLPADVKIIPGHGPLSNLDDLKKYHEMLMATTAIVRQGMATGKDVKTLQSEGFPEKWKEWGSGFINANRWIEIIFNSYAKK
ncbi:MAG: MBL fold metallo-hydrolase [Acidobacteria bacterium]|nr:MBL fold metallo-hydrolase [Acidobacteriota bacterium]